MISSNLPVTLASGVQFTPRTYLNLQRNSLPGPPVVLTNSGPTEFSEQEPDDNSTVPSLLVQWSEEQRLSALTNAYWSERMVEQLLVQTDHRSSQKEEEQLAQLQLALHKLERAKLEVAVYTEAIMKAARQWGHLGLASDDTRSTGDTDTHVSRPLASEIPATSKGAA